ncbi:MAG: hypothetical protein HZC16_01685 [Candidatus Omnitrophica bacterium]|nr:hypothetical protein [Candidatus Omnitrophota bacterium]
MKKIGRTMFASAVGVALLLFAGCAAMTTPVSNTTNLKEVDFSKEMKNGKSCQYYIFGLLGPFGDASVVNAAKDSSLSKVEVVDHKDGWYLLVSQHCVVVYGQ